MSEIRALDKVLENDEELNNKDETKEIRRYHCDLVNLESCREAFRGTDVVLHCAGLVDYDYRANADALQKNNVEGKTK